MSLTSSRKSSAKSKQSTISRFFTSTSSKKKSISRRTDQTEKLVINGQETSSKRSSDNNTITLEETAEKRRKINTGSDANSSLRTTATADTKQKLKIFASTFDDDNFTKSTGKGPVPLESSRMVVANEEPGPSELSTRSCLPNSSPTKFNAELDDNSANSEVDDGVSGQKTKTVDFSSFSSKRPCAKSTNSSPSTSNTGVKYTPLEKQVVEIKEKNPDVLLFVECGYKYRFFGEDAEIAAKELNIFCHPDHNFMTASIPTHRLHVHVRRLVTKGYKVGVVKQTETAALKAAGDNKNAPFTRHLASLYTKATLIGEDIDPSSTAEEGSSAGSVTSHLTCIFEPDSTEKKGKLQTIAIVSVEPATGEVLFDLFEDKITKDNLETRLTHIKPVEILLPTTISCSTTKLISQLVSQSSSCDDRIRTEKRPDHDFDLADAQRDLMQFYKNVKSADLPSTCSNERKTLDVADILNLPKPVICCLHALIIYLKEFNLHKILQITSNIKKFSTEKFHMQLNAGCLRNLEVFQNITNGKEHGSLIWIFDRTKTKFGGRLLRHWLARPLLDKKDIEDRLDAVTEILESDSVILKKVRNLLSNLPDVEKALTSVIHGKISPFDFCQLAMCLETVYKEIVIHKDSIELEVLSSLLQQLLCDLEYLLHGVTLWAGAIDEAAAKSCDKANMFVEEFKYRGIVKCKKEIEDVMNEIKDHRREVRLALRLPALDYTTVMGTEFLFELKHTQASLVPKDWIKINSTKSVSRYHSPCIVEAVKRLNQKREELIIEANNEWNKFLESFEKDYSTYKKAIHCLASLDCLFALADVAKQPGFSRPKLSDAGTCIEIREGRHPVIDALIGENEQYVPNSCNLSDSGKRAMIITGPNMGGKSSFIKQVGLITILAQMGSYVPAESAKIGIVDAVYTRMGASDELFKGRSTFVVELQEAANIMEKATKRSLVILDELGRGTSTHDGVAIAYATLKYFVTKMQCLILFVTHYPPLAEMGKLFPDHVTNNHMSFFVADSEENSAVNDQESITFLYELKEGMAARSYGLNVARLAAIPDDIVRKASVKSKELETLITDKRSNNEMFRKIYKEDKVEILLADN